MNPHDLQSVADLNLAEANREHARWTISGEIRESAWAVCVASATRFPAGPFNSATLLEDTADAEQVLNQTRAWFTERRRGFTFYVRSGAHRGWEAAFARANLKPTVQVPGMVLDAPTAPFVADSSLRIGATEDEVGCSNFIHVVSEGYKTMGLAPSATHKALGEARRWHTPHVLSRVLYENETPVAAGMLLLSHGIAGIYWIATVPTARGRGHAERITRALCSLAFERGAAAVILQASAQGEPVYRRIGFREICRYDQVLVPLQDSQA